MATEREYLIGLGLAKPSRGRFSATAQEALAEARAKGMVFDSAKPAPAVKADGEPVRTKVAALATPKTTVVKAIVKDDKGSQSIVEATLDPKAVRSWATQVGIKLGRGQIPAGVINQYFAANGNSETVAEPSRSFVTARAIETKPKVRDANEVYAIDGNNLIALGNCGKCKDHVSLCACNGGPRIPSYIDPQMPVALLTKPVV